MGLAQLFTHACLMLYGFPFSPILTNLLLEKICIVSYYVCSNNYTYIITCNYDTYVHLGIGHNKGKIRSQRHGDDCKNEHPIDWKWCAMFFKLSVKYIGLDTQEMPIYENSSHGVCIEMRCSWSWGCLQTLSCISGFLKTHASRSKAWAQTFSRRTIL